MSAENPMRQSMRTPTMSIGQIPGKVHLDWLHVREAMENGDDPRIGLTCYPGGSKDVNHDVMPGDLSIGYKCARADTGGFNELGFVSLAGLDTSAYLTHREMEDNFYAQGFAVTMCRVSDPMNDPMSPDPDHGYTVVKAGTVPTTNNGPMPFYPNQLVAWRFGPSRLSLPSSVGENDIPFGGINHRARQGTFQSQIRPELVPFDYTDFQIHYDSAYNLMSRNKTVGGIADLSFQETLDRRTVYSEDGTRMTLEQEEAAGHYWGTVNLVLAALEVLGANGITTIVDAQTRIQGALTQPGVNDLVRKIFANAYRSDIVAFNDGDVINAPAAGNAQKLRGLASVFHSGHVMGNFYSKTTKIVGKSMNYAAPTETVDMLAQHTVL